MIDAKHLPYRRSKFQTRLPLDRHYTRSHFWLRRADEDRFEVGFTRFATRMLGEIVEFDFEVAPGDEIGEGDVVGWIEGFKAVSELYSPLAGRFVGQNPALESLTERVHASPYGEAWLYSVAGALPASSLDAPGYAAFLDETIDRMMGTNA